VRLGFSWFFIARVLESLENYTIGSGSRKPPWEVKFLNLQ
jgi:hypothetical protein